MQMNIKTLKNWMLLLLAIPFLTNASFAEQISFPDPIKEVVGTKNLEGKSLRDIAHLYDQETKSSKSALFQNISGWMNKGLLIKKRVNLNSAFDRSPDPEEFKSAEESFAVNFEFFMKDPDFKCRRPSFYKYFSNLLKSSPFDSHDCQMNHTVTLISESSTSDKPIVTREIDPSRIYQVHYLFAGKGKQMMSRWGHAMFRLVLCAPGRPVGPDCLNDYAYHVVISYRANVEDMHIDYMKGMNGAYASQLFLMNMSEVVDEYTKGEFRDMISLPMKMNQEQITHFTDKLLENYWSYKGRYYFLTNNCATEAMNLLRVAFPENAPMQTANIVTPLGLYSYLIKNNITDVTLLDDQQNAISKGYLFQGVNTKLQKSLNLFVNTKEVSFDDFILKLTPNERKIAYQKAIDVSTNQSSTEANALRLEEQILLSREKLFAKKMGDALFGKTPMPELQGTVLEEKILAMKDLFKKLSAANYLAKGYGIPLEEEFKPATTEEIQTILTSIKGNMAELREISVKFFPKEVEDMTGTIENRQWLMGLLVPKM